MNDRRWAGDEKSEEEEEVRAVRLACKGLALVKRALLTMIAIIS